MIFLIKTDVMFGMMNDAGMTASKKLTAFGMFIQNQDMEAAYTWALILCNLAYTPACTLQHKSCIGYNTVFSQGYF